MVLLVRPEDAPLSRRILEGTGWRFKLGDRWPWRIFRTAAYLYDDRLGIDLMWGIPVPRSRCHGSHRSSERCGPGRLEVRTGSCSRRWNPSSCSWRPRRHGSPSADPTATRRGHRTWPWVPTRFGLGRGSGTSRRRSAPRIRSDEPWHRRIFRAIRARRHATPGYGQRGAVPDSSATSVGGDRNGGPHGEEAEARASGSGIRNGADLPAR